MAAPRQIDRLLEFADLVLDERFERGQMPSVARIAGNQVRKRAKIESVETRET